MSFCGFSYIKISLNIHINDISYFVLVSNTLYFVLVQTCLKSKTPNIFGVKLCPSGLCSLLGITFLFTNKNLSPKIYCENVMDIALFIGKKLKLENKLFLNNITSTKFSQQFQNKS